MRDGVLGVAGADGEDGGKAEHLFLHGHHLEVHAEVEGGDADFADFLVGPDPGAFADEEVGNAGAGDHQVGVGVCYVVTGWFVSGIGFSGRWCLLTACLRLVSP